MAKRALVILAEGSHELYWIIKVCDQTIIIFEHLISLKGAEEMEFVITVDTLRRGGVSLHIFKNTFNCQQ